MGEAIFLGKFKKYLECFQYCSAKNHESGNIQFPERIWRERQILQFGEQSSGQDYRSESISNFLRADTLYHILDFGGGSGWLFEKIQSVHSEKFEYCLVETNESLQLFADLHEGRRGVGNFMALNLDQLSTRQFSAAENVLYINSVLQYIKEPIRKIEEILSVYLASTIIFDDLANCERDNFWTCQRYYGHLVPYHFLNLPELISSISGLGFSLVEQNNYTPSFSDGWDFRVENLGESISFDNPKTLIFKNESIDH